MDAQYPLSPTIQHPGGQKIIDYQEWAKRTRSSQMQLDKHLPLGTPGLKDRRFNDDPTEFYGRMAAVRATKENGKVNCNPSWQKL